MTVKHKTLHQRIDGEVSDEDFIVVINTALDNVIEDAFAAGKVVDWSTLQIEPTDAVETFTASGKRQSHSLGLNLRVDSVSVEEDE